VFTGLVSELGQVESFDRNEQSAKLRIGCALAAGLTDGDSVAVNGVCLTAVDAGSEGFSADLSAETIERSTLADLVTGSRVNLELAMRLDDRLGGHIVQGHVDGVATVSATRDDGNGKVIEFSADAALLRYVVEKGPIAVDGVSLTVTKVTAASFSVSLIPETLERTNLTQVKTGDRVNLEVDLFAKYVEKLGRHDA